MECRSSWNFSQNLRVCVTLPNQLTMISLSKLLVLSVPFVLYYVGSVFNGIAYSMVLEAFDPLSFFFLIPVYSGLTLGGVTIAMNERAAKTSSGAVSDTVVQDDLSWFLRGLSSIHVVATLAGASAVFLAGPSLSQVCSAVAPLFACLLQYIVLGTMATKTQILSILIIVGGLASRVYFKEHPSTEVGAEPSSGPLGEHTVYAGVLASFMSTFLYNCGNVFSQRILQPRPSASGDMVLPAKITPGMFLFRTGCNSILISCLVILVWTVPQWETFHMDLGELAADTFVWQAIALVILCQSSINIGFIGIVTTYGAVAQSVVSGLNTIGVLVMSHLWACDPNGSPEAQAECMTPTTVYSSIAVTCGVILYGLAPKPVAPFVNEKSKSD